MASTPYPFGQAVEIPAKVVDRSGAPTDPVTLTLTVERPDGTVDSYTIGRLVRVQVGVYYLDYLPPASGHYAWRYAATSPTAAVEGTFDVLPTMFGSDAGQMFVPSGYLTVAEFKALPTGVTFDDLIRAGSAKLNDAELANILLRSSRWADTYCRVPIGATATTAEHQEIRPRSDGLLRIAPRRISGRIPLIAMTRVAWGYPGMLTSSITPSYPPWVQDGVVQVPAGGSFGWAGPAIQFGGPPPGGSVWVEYDYISGFANTWLTTAATAGDTSLVVADTTGITPGLSLRISDPGSEEQVTVASSWAPTTGPAMIPLTAALTSAHTLAVGVSAVPMDVKLAVGQIAVTIIRRSADTGTVGDFGHIGPGIDHDAASDMPDYVGAAASILDEYRRHGPN